MVSSSRDLPELAARVSAMRLNSESVKSECQAFGRVPCFHITSYQELTQGPEFKLEHFLVLQVSNDLNRRLAQRLLAQRQHRHSPVDQFLQPAFESATLPRAGPPLCRPAGLV